MTLVAIMSFTRDNIYGTDTPSSLVVAPVVVVLRRRPRGFAVGDAFVNGLFNRILVDSRRRTWMQKFVLSLSV